MSLAHATVFLIDGENLTLRYAALLKEGRRPQKGVVYERDVFVWHYGLVGRRFGDIRRVTYFTSAVGDQDRIIAVTEQLRTFKYSFFDGHNEIDATVVGRVFKRRSGREEAKAVDINLVLEGLRHVRAHSMAEVHLYSGDGDFIPFITEAMHLGARVHVAALSSGLNPGMKTAGDSFRLLDDIFFLP